MFGYQAMMASDGAAGAPREVTSPTALAHLPPMLLATDIWVSALIRRAEQGGAFAVVVRKGDVRAGAVLVKVLNRADDSSRVYAEATRMDGERVWMQPANSTVEQDLDSYIERAVRIDPDLWVIEIEDRQGRHFLTEPVERS
jgi:hypothetical protein